MIPRIIHQTWKSHDVPDALRHFSRTWRTHNPDWEYRLWSDQDNRDFIARHYPYFLPVFDAYEAPICRADAVRYFLLKHFGGVYVDLDFECLSALDELLRQDAAMLGEEPALHLKDQYKRGVNLDHLVCNAWMASPPGHPFWDHVIECMIAARGEPGPLDATGPLMLTRAVDSYRGNAAVEILPHETLYPVTSWDERSGNSFSLEFWIQHTREAHAVHRWAGTWYRGHEREPALPTEGAKVQVLEHARPIYDAVLHWRGLPPPDTASPLVSCLMVTRNRAAQARVAVECFLRQNYPARELVILDDGEDDALREQIAALADPRIRIFRPDGERATLGELRNRAVALARGTYVCQWDDDDFYDPARIACQMAALRITQAEACFLQRWTLWWPGEKRLALSTRRLWEGSMLCLKSRMPLYPALTRGEDTPVANQLLAGGRVVLLDQPRLYVYVAHSGNTFDREHFERHWSAATARFEGDDYRRMLQELSLRLPFDARPDGLHTGPGAQSVAPALSNPATEPGICDEIAPPSEVPAPPPSPRRATGDAPQVLILTPIRNAARLLPRYFELACALDHPRDRLSLVFLEGDSDDGTPDVLRELVAHHAHAFARIEILRRNFGLQIAGERSAASIQYLRRSVLAKCRNALFHGAHRDEDYILWIDADLVDYPPDVLTRLLDTGHRIVVPHCVRQAGGETFDLNTFAFIPGTASWSGMVDGIAQPPRGTGRRYLQDFRGTPQVEVDGVGGTMLLVDAALHRAGLLFPDYSYRGFIETEGFAMMARDRGIRAWGLPDLEVVHLDG